MKTTIKRVDCPLAYKTSKRLRNVNGGFVSLVGCKVDGLYHCKKRILRLPVQKMDSD